METTPRDYFFLFLILALPIMAAAVLGLIQLRFLYPLANDSLVAAISQSYDGRHTITLQDGSDGYSGTRDTYLYNYHATANFGSATSLRSSEIEIFTMLVRFQIFQSEGGPIPNDAIIQSATLGLYKNSVYDSTYQAYRLLKDWDESQATWSSPRPGASWTGGRVSRTDALLSADGSASIGWNPAWLTVNVTDGVRAFARGANYGWSVYSKDPGSGSGGAEGNNNTKYFNSRESGDVTLRPKLTIIYTLPTANIDTLPIPTGLSVTAVSSSQINLAWSASAGGVAVAGYKIFRGGTQITTVERKPGALAETTYSNTGLSPSTLYSYTVSAYDAAGNNSTQSLSASATTLASADSALPIVSITAPASGATVSGSSVKVLANASDNIAVAGVQFKLDGANLGLEDTTVPYSAIWNTTLATNGAHSLSAVARDTASNIATAPNIAVTVSNPTTVAPSTKFVIGDRVQVTATLNVRSTPSTSGILLGTQTMGALGTVIGGPTYASGYHWWQVNYDTGADGWSVENYLIKAPSLVDGGTIGWTELANTNIRRVCPPNKTGEYDWNSFCKGVIDAWSGGAVDTRRNRLIVFGGGHSDYAGNEIYAINLLSNTVERITNPSPPNLSGYNIYGDTCPSVLVDGAPNSRHSYDGVVYIPDLDRLFVFGGSLACKTGNGDNVTWMYDFASGHWLRANPTGTLPRWDLGIVAAYDASSKKVFVHDNYALFAYDIATNTFTRLTGDSDFVDIHMTAAVDPVHKKLVIVGGGWNSGVGGVIVYDIKPGSTYTRELWATTGGNAVANAASPGLAYDPVSGRMIGWAGGNTVYSLNMDTKVWTPITFSGGPSAQGMNGTFGRFDYVPALKAFAVVNHVDRNAFLLRLASATMTPDPIPPSIPINIEPGIFTAIAAPDKGKGVPGQGMKHVTFAYNPDNGRIYQEGGDFPGPGGEQSYRQDTYSLSLTERLADPTNRNAGWRQEYAYCGPVGKVQPKHPDFVGWTWDSLRHIFWMVPGTMEISSAGNCPGETFSRITDPAFLLNHIMTFDPTAQEWTDRGTNIGLDPVETWQSVYDPVNDTIIRFGFNGGSGGVVNIYTISTNSWIRLGLGVNALGQDIRLNKEGVTVDLTHRFIYAVDGFHGRLHRFNMDTKKMEDLGGVPGSANMSGSTNDAYVAWNSNDNILYFFRLENSTLYIYHPDAKTWGSPAMITSPAGLYVAMRHAMVFDPANDVLVMMGGVEPVNPYIFLYRYK